MEKGDGEITSDDGIVAEDVTQLVEHIELTSPHRLPEAHEWELATPATDLDEAPILFDDVGDDDPELDSMDVAEDNEQFTETQADLNQLLPPGERRRNQAAAMAAERARWQKRVEGLLRSLAERDQLLAERERRIEDLSAKLATRTLEREGLVAELREVRPAGAADPVAEPSAVDADFTLELPTPLLPPVAPAVSAHAAPRLRRYLIGLDVVGCVHELARRRINIGRTRDNDLRIVDPTVSRLHAMLTLRDGEAMLVDANSRNGIFVNGIQVRYARLDDGDLVTFGTVRFRYRVGSDMTGGSA